MSARTKAAVGDVLPVAFVLGSVFVGLSLVRSQPLDSLATPTPTCIEEIGAIAILFLVWVAVMQPAKDAWDRSTSFFTRLLRKKVELSRPIRAAAFVLFAFGLFAFALWAVADVLGGYNGYDYSFSTYPTLALIYNDTIGLIPYLSSRDKGTQASFYFILAIAGLVAQRLNRGVGAALRDAITMFAAPCLVVFELALLNSAPEDMTWHATDYLWIGGIADGGWRSLDYGPAPNLEHLSGGGNYVYGYISGDYLISNWLVLFVALFLVASRIPWLSMPSRMLWRRKSGGLQEGTGGISVGGRNEGERGIREVPRVGWTRFPVIPCFHHSGFSPGELASRPTRTRTFPRPTACESARAPQPPGP